MRISIGIKVILIDVSSDLTRKYTQYIWYVREWEPY